MISVFVKAVKGPDGSVGIPDSVTQSPYSMSYLEASKVPYSTTWITGKYWMKLLRSVFEESMRILVISALGLPMFRN